jgi:NDP-sugar pyrophosphorylase family protein
VINVLIPAAGNGLRFSSVGVVTPKPLIFVNGKTFIEHAIDTMTIPDSRFVILSKKFNDSRHNDKLYKILNNSPSEVRHLILDSDQHKGAAHTSFLSKGEFEHFSWMEDPLIITNCDQILNWDPENFLNFIKEKDPDGAVILYKSDNPKNSFAKIKNGKIVEIIEKRPISNDALIGVHYWKKASDFFDSAAELLYEKELSPSESYISETYNFLMNRNKTILPYYFEEGQYISLGTPEDVDIYAGNSDWRNQ